MSRYVYVMACCLSCLTNVFLLPKDYVTNNMLVCVLSFRYLLENAFYRLLPYPNKIQQTGYYSSKMAILYGSIYILETWFVDFQV
jgi:hypothetical protein